MAVEELHELVNVVGIHPVGDYVSGSDFSREGIALRFGARSYHYLLEHLGVLRAFMSHDGTDASGSDDKNFSHIFVFIFSFKT